MNPALIWTWKTKENVSSLFKVQKLFHLVTINDRRTGSYKGKPEVTQKKA